MPRLLYLARHGETDWNAAQRWQGHTDVPLNENGRAQARALAERLRAVGLGAVVTSDLSRANETGRIVADALGLPLAYVDGELRERAFGVFEGLTRQECETLHTDAWRAWLEGKQIPRGGEPHESLTERLLRAVGRVAAEVARDEAPALVVTHGGALRAIVNAATGTNPPPIKNGAVWVLVWEGRVVTLREMELQSSSPSS
ncbi:MAG TPA: histidine phosphatase family protein [Polyangiaceae bacterium]|jgi:probable phosphoglycerate mutase